MLFSQSFAQTKSPNEYQLKAAFIYNFIRFVDWPPSASNPATSPFVIGIMGDDKFEPYVAELVRGERLGNRSFVVERFGSVKDLKYCNILFISGDDAGKVRDMLPAINRRGILTVSDAPNFAKWGGIIRFFTEEKKLRLQINIDEARASQIAVSSKLLSLSTIYRAN